MNRFAELLDRLTYEPARNAKLRLMTEYFRSTPDPERGWALAALTGELIWGHAPRYLMQGREATVQRWLGAFSREQIAAAALEIADADGFDAVSMRSIATKLGEHDVKMLQAMKTGALLRFACQAGGILAAASPVQREALERYGAVLGEAFQIADDILDVEGDAAAVGKATGKDAAAGKATMVGILGLPGAKARFRDQQLQPDRQQAADQDDEQAVFAHADAEHVELSLQSLGNDHELLRGAHHIVDGGNRHEDETDCE